jgi:NAD(P)H-hydrate repair Nnr-like enzyme with NAD(P)H-hydrate dehydratase domain
MATAGSGDVLTGIILGLLARGCTPVDAACLGVFLHGRSGDIAQDSLGVESLIASDLIDNLGAAYLSVHHHLK